MGEVLQVIPGLEHLTGGTRAPGSPVLPGAMASSAPDDTASGKVMSGATVDPRGGQGTNLPVSSQRDLGITCHHSKPDH